jgi:hypothetical protein
MSQMILKWKMLKLNMGFLFSLTDRHGRIHFMSYTSILAGFVTFSLHHPNIMVRDLEAVR